MKFLAILIIVWLFYGCESTTFRYGEVDKVIYNKQDNQIIMLNGRPFPMLVDESYWVVLKKDSIGKQCIVKFRLQKKFISKHQN